MTRAEWEARFRKQIIERIVAWDGDALRHSLLEANGGDHRYDDIVKVELESWTDPPDGDSDNWWEYEPEVAADENLSHWADG